MSHHQDPFTRIEWILFRVAFILLLIYELSKFFKHLYDSW
jgi:hypothetical protein